MSNKKTAFVTGAAMGMGALQARTLAERGWDVYAGVMPGADTSELLPCDNVTAIEQNVADDESVKASGAEVEKALNGRGLDLLINNAGIANTGIGVIEGADMERGKYMFEVNTWGQVRVLQALLPALRRAEPPARIINFASGAVRANPPASGFYNMSKHAVMGLTMTLRHELAVFGIEVTAIEPGAVKTHLTADAFETTKNIWREVPEKVRDVYHPHLGKTATQVLPESIEKSGNPPEYVVNQVLALLDIKNWKPSYMVGRDVKVMPVLLKLLPVRMMEKLIRKQFQIPSHM